MKKVVNVSVGGRSFSLDEDAYARLTAYFDHFKALLDKDTQSAKEEVMTDLENRIAELFDQGIGGASYRVVNLDLVTRVVEQLGMPTGRRSRRLLLRIRLPKSVRRRGLLIILRTEARISLTAEAAGRPKGGSSAIWTTR